MGKSRNNNKGKTYNEIQLDQRGVYRSRWQMVHEDKRLKRLPPKGTRFILEDEEVETIEPINNTELEEDWALAEAIEKEILNYMKED